MIGIALVIGFGLICVGLSISEEITKLRQAVEKLVAK